MVGDGRGLARQKCRHLPWKTKDKPVKDRHKPFGVIGHPNTRCRQQDWSEEPPCGQTKKTGNIAQPHRFSRPLHGPRIDQGKGRESSTAAERFHLDDRMAGHQIWLVPSEVVGKQGSKLRIGLCSTLHRRHCPQAPLSVQSNPCWGPQWLSFI